MSGIYNPLRLIWMRPTGGYRLDGRFFIPIGTPERYEPMRVSGALFRTFADTEPSQEGICGFISRFGPLRYGNPGLGISAIPADSYQQELNEMKEAVVRLENGETGWIAARLGLYGRGSCDAHLWQPEPEQPPQFILQPRDLICAMWLQLGMAIADNAAIKKCQWCGTWFVYGTGTGRRSTARFCSDPCRKAAHKHKKEQQQ